MQSSRSAPTSRWRGLPVSPSSGSTSRCLRSTPRPTGGRSVRTASTTRSTASAHYCWSIEKPRFSLFAPLFLHVVVRLQQQAAGLRGEGAVIGAGRSHRVGVVLELLAAVTLLVVPADEVAGQQEHLFPVVVHERLGGQGAGL